MRIVQRASGVLLHPTSLPGPYGIGDLGPDAYAFADLLDAGRQTYWQILPLGPTGLGDSPYQALSAFAGNPLLLSPDALIDDGLLPASVREERPAFPDDAVDFAAVRTFKEPLLARAFETFERDASPAQRQQLADFAAAEAGWLDDFALFMALHEAHGGVLWTEWPAALARREPDALERSRADLAPAFRRHVFAQFLFARQWSALKRYANAKGVRLFGDMPIYVAHQSADCWARPELFTLGPDGNPSQVAGVPPDYFSATGQRWGNPLYRWDVLEASGYAWWIDRFRAALQTVDQIRIDHFRGFAAYWVVPAHQPTAMHGRWRRGPGAALFVAVQEALGKLPLVAEDLGLITPNVKRLRDRFGFPGMKVLQFGFSGPDNEHLPHHHDRNSVVYTGTHDNDTAAGWFVAAPEHERRYALEYMGWPADPVGGLLRLAYASVADTAIIPLQDYLRLGSEARMNLPGETFGHWRWRCPPDRLDASLVEQMTALAGCYGRAKAETAPPAV